MTRYIENIDISFSISIYRIVSYRRRKKIDFCDIQKYRNHAIFDFFGIFITDFHYTENNRLQNNAI